MRSRKHQSSIVFKVVAHLTVCLYFTVLFLKGQVDEEITFAVGDFISSTMDI